MVKRVKRKEVEKWTYREKKAYMKGVEDSDLGNAKQIDIVKEEIQKTFNESVLGQKKVELLRDVYIETPDMWRLMNVGNGIYKVGYNNSQIHKWAEWFGISIYVTQDRETIAVMGFEENYCMINYIKDLWTKYKVVNSKIFADHDKTVDIYAIQHGIEWWLLSHGVRCLEISPKEFKNDIEILNGINKWIGLVLKITNYKEITKYRGNDEYHILRRNIIDEVNDAWDKHKDGIGNVIDLLNTDHHQHRLAFTALHAEEDRTKAYVNYSEE